ncbi:MAG TPA: farnesyl diphosphate synthase [Vicinamibacterales bacterium]|nr:farnesyl diphosphate synthase [Vicinamibacterales bacterium]
MAESLDAFLRRGRVLVDEALDRWLPKPPACPAIVAEAMRYSVFAGGKRLRPMLTLAAAEAVDRDAAPRALPAACAIEMIHTYSLIHDDLPAMDNDTLRRGRPTLHVVYGDGVAILAGDGLHAEAFTLLGQTPADDPPELPRRRLRVLDVIGRAAGPAGMVGGQAIDLQAAGQVPGHAVTLDADGLRDMHARKTGALIHASALSGAIIAGADEQQAAGVALYAREIGVAFQIVDDVLDVEGSAAQLGKSAGKDAAAAKPTYPSLFGVDRSRILAVECVDRALAAIDAAGLTDGQLPAIARWVVSRRN